MITTEQLADMGTWRKANDRLICRGNNEPPSDFNIVCEFWNSGDADKVLEMIAELMVLEHPILERKPVQP